MKKWLMLALAALSGSALARTAMSNADWRVEIDPATLAMSVQPAGKPLSTLSRGTASHAVSALEQAATSMRWQWAQQGVRFEARLQGADLRLTVHGRPGTALTVLDQPARAAVRGLMLPLGEGSYVPANDAGWQAYLLRHKAELSMSEDLALPVWGLDQGDHTLSWMLASPFNSTLQLARDERGVSLSLQHVFSRLAPDAPLDLVLHLGGPDLLAPALRYRQYLQQQGQFQSMVDKIRAQPLNARLPGATHLYLWGNEALGMQDVRDWSRLGTVLRKDSGLTAAFDAEARKALAGLDDRADRYRKRVVLEALNQSLAAQARSGSGNGDDPARIPAAYGRVLADARQTLGDALVAHPQGGTFSVRTIRALQAAGLTKLWVGTEGWEAGLWHPEAATAAVSAGYLAGPYDSYETALPADGNPDWVSARQGPRVYRDCGIGLADGSLKKGFQQSGYYTNPVCVRAYMQARVRALLEATAFNSWFLDAWGTGMVFDDYRGKLGQAAMASAYSDNMAWVAARVPVGSEGGNAATVRGISFAHGMQVPVMGWGDPDMQKDRSSRFYLGRWYPAGQPEMFFKPVPLKAEYVRAHLDPAFRLPLYQAVFHDAVVTTNHWMYDNLKFPNVARDNALLQQLYNVPPLYHLSEGTLAARLPLIRQGDAFFRPLHARLATVALTGFAWLTPDRTVQETRFADGSRIVANFGGQVFRGIPAGSVRAWPAGEAPRTFTAP